MSAKLVDDFFTRHFGENLKLHRFMETILLSNNIVSIYTGCDKNR